MPKFSWRGLRLSLACVLGMLTLAAAQSTTVPKVAGPWTLVWSDEFSGKAGSQPGSASWNYDLGNEDAAGWGNRELEYYTRDSANVRLDGQGNLEIWARKNSRELWCWDGYACPYTSARLNTRGHFQLTYGKVEVRMSVPVGPGYWPAFWMLGADGPWPANGELDVMEWIGRTPDVVYGTMHGPGYSGAAGIGKTVPVTNPAAFHTYTLIKRKTEVLWLLDGQVYHRLTPQDIPGDSPWVFDQPMYLLLNLAVGGNFPGKPDQTTPFPGVMKVDYVRVWREGK